MTGTNSPAYLREYNARPRSKRLRAAANRRRRQKVMAPIRAARERPCADCGVQLPGPCMHLDHARGVKLFALGNASWVPIPKGMTRDTMVAAEIAKCDVRCPNCHALRHYKERHGTR
jgi:hypothetical protein